MSTHCKWSHLSNANFRKVASEVKGILGDNYNFNVFKCVADNFEGDVNSLTAKYVLDNWPQKDAPQEKIFQEQPTSSQDNPKTITAHYGFWTRAEAESPENQDKLYIFTDNTDRNSGREPISDDSRYAQKYGKGKHYPKRATSAVLRGLDNAFPISTQRWYHEGATRERGRWTNADLEEFKTVIHQEIDDIIQEWNTGKYTQIILPQGGLFTESEITGINDDERSRIKRELIRELKRLYEAVGMPYTETPETAEPTQEQQQKENRIRERSQAKKERDSVAKWARFADGRDSIEVSSAGDEFGRQFSALAATFPEGTVITIAPTGVKKGVKQTFNIGGYSVEAAYQLIKGYDGNPKGSLVDKDGKLLHKIIGKGKAPISEVLRIDVHHRITEADRRAMEEFSYNNAYYPLWKKWAGLNPDLMNQLKRKSRRKVLTDRFANSNVSQARALSEIMWGKPRKTSVSELLQTEYDVQWERAQKASEQVPKDARKGADLRSIHVLREKLNPQQVANVVNGLTESGAETDLKPMILAYTLDDPQAMRSVFHEMVNPFHGQKGAIAKFIQWIIPDSFNALPEELRVEQDKRNRLRSMFAKGGYTKTDILAGNSPEDISYAKVLRYVIDHFQELRQRYNPIDIRSFGGIHQRVNVYSPNKYKIGDNPVLLFAPLETAPYGTELDETSAFKLERKRDADGAETDEFIITFPEGYRGMYSLPQRQRIFKTIARALEEGQTVTIDPAIANDEMVDDFHSIVARGFTAVRKKYVTYDDGYQENAGVYQRNKFQRPMVETRENFRLADVHNIQEDGKIYVAETYPDYWYDEGEDKYPNVIPIFTSGRDPYNASERLSDDNFDDFKKLTDAQIEKLKKAIDDGFIVVITKDALGSGRTALNHYAPRCFEYLQQKVQELKEYGNEEATVNQYFRERSANVEAINTAPSESISLDHKALQSPRATLRQRFTDRQIKDFARYFSDEFLYILNDENNKLANEVKARIAAESDENNLAVLKARLNKVQDPANGLVETINTVGLDKIFGRVKNIMKSDAKDFLQRGNADLSMLYADAMKEEYFDIIFGYAIPIIEENSGIRISQTQRVAENAQSKDEEEEDLAEDLEGNNTNEMGWSYNFRMVDPFKSLSRSIRTIISGIRMRDPNDRRKNIINSIGKPQKYSAPYIYSCIMSRMAQMTLGEIDNFMRLTPREQLSERDYKKFPLGKPVFPVLESMRTRYPWVDDVIMRLEADFRVDSVANGTIHKVDLHTTADELVASPEMLALMGNRCSQFYVNFSQQFLKYATMVNGSVVDENGKTGATSLKKSAIANYNGNIRFKGIDMIYNADGSVNGENLDKAIDKLKEIYDTLYTQKSKSDEDATFWDAIKTLRKDYGNNVVGAFEAAPAETKELVKSTADILKAAGIVFPDFTVFGIIYENKNPGILDLVYQLRETLEALRGLPSGEHMFESSYTLSRVSNTKETGYSNAEKWDSPRVAWNRFFRKFGDYVTDQELEASPRISGKTRYSYAFSSFLSMEISNLVNPDIDARRKYIEENYMIYDWFFDKTTGKFRNILLEKLYSDELCIKEGILDGHDMLIMKDGIKEKEYQDWMPEDIVKLMFRELVYPTNTEYSNFIMPVLSDSTVCKAVQLPNGRGIPRMVNIVRQEMERMKLVEKRRIILHMQDIQEKIDNGAEIDDNERKYYDQNLEYFNKHRQQHPEKLQEIENFDDNGTKFCFYPELNDYAISAYKAERDGNSLLMQVVRLLSKDPNNPSSKIVALKDVIQAIQNMSDENFDRRVAALELTKEVREKREENGLHIYRTVNKALNKDELINKIIGQALREVIDRKVRQLLYDGQGNYNEYVINGMLRADPKFAEDWYKKPVESENHKLTAEEKEDLKWLHDNIEGRVRGLFEDYSAAMSEFLQLMVTDIAYYKDPTALFGSIDFGKRFKEVYGSGMRLNTNSKFGKKIERNIILKDKVRRSRSFDTLEGVLDKAVEEGRIDSVEKDAVLYKFKKIKGTDAQAFRSLTSWRDIMDMIGRNSKEVANAIENLRNDRWTMSDFYTVFNTIKPFTYGPENQDSGIDDIRMRTMVQHKNSEAVLLAIYNTLIGSSAEDANYSSTLRGLNRAMEEIYLTDENGEVMTYMNGEKMKAIDVAQYQSAVKVGAHGVIDINYSRRKLAQLWDEGKMKVGNEELEIKKGESYYRIAKRIDALLDSKKITFDEYNEAMDSLEPDEQEVFDIIKNSIYKNVDESLGYDDQVLHKIPYKYYCIQQPTDDHYTDNEAGTFGSQPRHIIFSDLPADFKITINGKTYDRDGIRQRYNSLIVANLIDSYEREIAPLFRDNGETGRDGKKKSSIEKLRDRLMPIIESNPKYGKQLKDALEIVTDENGNKTFALPLNNLTVSAQLEEVIASLFKNAIHRQKINGGNAILAADVGYSRQLKVRGERDAQGKLIPGKIEGVECYLPAHMRAMFEPYLITKTKNVGGKTVTYKVLDAEKLKRDGMDKLIGYRIPTEGTYSIIPLIVAGFLPQQSGSSIVVAQEIVELTGSDNDVDKLFLMVKAMNKNLKVIKTTKNGETLHPLEMTKKQRDNEIIDIFYGITTHEKLSHRWLHPGNFDTILLNARRIRILKSRRLMQLFQKNAGLANLDQVIAYLTRDLPEKTYNELYRRVMQVEEGKEVSGKTLLDVVVDFTDMFSEPLSPVYPDTFIKMHQTYMAGVAEKGIFANNRLDNTKLQWANVTLSPAYTFSFEGRRVQKIDEIQVQRKRGNRAYMHYVSDDCAESSAAAVDNGKTPTLGDLNSNTSTATFFGFLTRLGLGIDGAALLLSQPEVDRSINSTGGISKKLLERKIQSIEKWMQNLHIDKNEDRFNWRMHDFNTEEWVRNMVYGRNLKELMSHGIVSESLERIASLYRTYNLILNLLDINEEMNEPRTILHYDSPNHAADITMGGVIEQTKAVEEVNKRATIPASDRRLRGEDQLIVYKIEQKAEAERSAAKSTREMSNEEKLRNASPKYRLFNTLMGAQMPITQAFYTLGIEKIMDEIAPHFVFGRRELQKLTDKLYDHMKDKFIRSADARRKIMSLAFKDWVVFRLSKTTLFGDDDNMTFDQKRQYYLYEFPTKFLQLKEQIPELMEIDATRRMTVKKNMIILDRQGETPLSVRDFITDSFDTLLQSTNPEVRKVAKDLFLYTYYLNGFEFSYMSYGNFIGTEFQRAFPEYIKALNDLNTETITDNDIENFFLQFTLKRNDKGLLRTLSFKDTAEREETAQKGYYVTDMGIEYYGAEEKIDEFVNIISIVRNTAKTNIFRYSPELTRMYGKITYTPVNINTTLHYNANQTVDEMLDVVYDQNVIDAHKQLGKRRTNRQDVIYTTHQATSSMTVTSNSRTENRSEIDGSPEPRNVSSSQAASMMNEEDGLQEREVSDDVMKKAVMGDNEEGGLSFEEYDAMVQRKPQMLEDNPANDKDIEEAQELLKKNNNGKGLC